MVKHIGIFVFTVSGIKVFLSGWKVLVQELPYRWILWHDSFLPALAVDHKIRVLNLIQLHVNQFGSSDPCIEQLDPMTNAFIQMSGVFAELELRIIRERVRSGMRNAKAKGAKIGRPQTTLDDIPANFLRHYPAYKNGAYNLTELARLCAVSRTTVYKYIGLLET